MNKLILKLSFILVVVFLSSCGGDSDPGYEFMPNMYRSPSLETYGENAVTGINAQLPVDGSLEGYLSAGNTAVNPIENNDKNVSDGKALYGMFCEHCHGQTGAGDGTIMHPVYSAVPHYNDDKLKRRCDLPMCDLKAGHIFHAITYGLNAMGPHASQINEEERWKITLYVQEELQQYGQN